MSGTSGVSGGSSAFWKQMEQAFNFPTSAPSASSSKPDPWLMGFSSVMGPEEAKMFKKKFMEGMCRIIQQEMQREQQNAIKELRRLRAVAEGRDPDEVD